MNCHDFIQNISREREEALGKLRDLEPTGPPDRTYKVVFAGDAAVGKTSFINRITKGVFMSNLSSTLGVDFQVIDQSELCIVTQCD